MNPAARALGVSMLLAASGGCSPFESTPNVYFAPDRYLPLASAGDWSFVDAEDALVHRTVTIAEPGAAPYQSCLEGVTVSWYGPRDQAGATGAPEFTTDFSVPAGCNAWLTGCSECGPDSSAPGFAPFTFFEQAEYLDNDNYCGAGGGGCDAETGNEAVAEGTAELNPSFPPPHDGDETWEVDVVAEETCDWGDRSEPCLKLVVGGFEPAPFANRPCRTDNPWDDELDLDWHCGFFWLVLDEGIVRFSIDDDATWVRTD